jgi:hypothetical protein
VAATELSRLATYRVVVDWDVDDAYTGTSEDVTADVLATPAPTIEMGRDQIRELAPPMISAAAYELNNRAQTYSAEFPGSPIYGLMLPGRRTEIRAQFGDVAYEADDEYDSLLPYSGDAFPIFTGLIDEPTQHPEHARRSVGIVAYGTMSRLRRNVSTELYESIAIGTAIGYLLDAAGWPAADRDIDAGQTTLLYWWLADEDALAAAIALTTTEGAGAALYEDGSGVIHFEDRAHRSTETRSTTSQAIYYDTSIGSEPLYEELADYDTDEFYNGASGLHHVAPLTYAPGFRDIVNSVSLEVTQRTVAALGVVWTYGAALTLGASETKVITAKLSSAPAKAIVCTNGVDVTVSAGAISSATINRTSGQIVAITLVAGAGGATVNLLQLRGQSCAVSATIAVTNSTDTSDSQTAYGVRPLPSGATMLTDISVPAAESLADAIVERYQQPLAAVEMALVNVNGEHLVEILTRRVSDRITIVESQTGLNNDFWVERISHEIAMAGRRHVAVLGCSKAALSADAVFGWDAAESVFDTATWGA